MLIWGECQADCALVQRALQLRQCNRADGEHGHLPLDQGDQCRQQLLHQQQIDNTCTIKHLSGILIIIVTISFIVNALITMTVQHGEVLVANLGDSRAVACIHGAARPLTQVHRAQMVSVVDGVMESVTSGFQEGITEIWTIIIQSD